MNKTFFFFRAVVTFLTCSFTWFVTQDLYVNVFKIHKSLHSFLEDLKSSFVPYLSNACNIKLKQFIDGLWYPKTYLPV